VTTLVGCYVQRKLSPSTGWATPLAEEGTRTSPNPRSKSAGTEHPLKTRGGSKFGQWENWVTRPFMTREKKNSEGAWDMLVTCSPQRHLPGWSVRLLLPNFGGVGLQRIFLCPGPHFKTQPGKKKKKKNLGVHPMVPTKNHTPQTRKHQGG